MSIVLIAGDNTLDVAMPPIPVVSFNPWVYDINKSCYIEKGEALQASNDYYAGLITKSQLQEIITLWQNNIRNPVCDILPPLPPDENPLLDYSGKREWCAYRFAHVPEKDAVVTETTGKIGNLSVSLTKAGMAGVEATFKITTGGENWQAEYIFVEVLGWWQPRTRQSWFQPQRGRFLTGMVIYDYNYSPFRTAGWKVIDIDAGEILRYTVSITSGGVLTRIWNSAGVLIHEYLYECDAKRIVTFQTELEYWRYYDVIGGEYVIREGQFSFAGDVILEQLYQQGVGWVNAADVLSFPGPTTNATVGIAEPKDLLSYDLYRQGGIMFKGRVVDIV